MKYIEKIDGIYYAKEADYLIYPDNERFFKSMDNAWGIQEMIYDAGILKLNWKTNFGYGCQSCNNIEIMCEGKYVCTIEMPLYNANERFVEQLNRFTAMSVEEQYKFAFLSVIEPMQWGYYLRDKFVFGETDPYKYRGSGAPGLPSRPLNDQYGWYEISMRQLKEHLEKCKSKG